MARYLLKRFGQTLLIVVIVSFLTFLLVSLMPGDPVYALYGTDISQEEYETAYRMMSLDKSVITRYFIWAKSFLTGDFGTSYRYHMPVTDIIGQKISITLYLSIVSTLISFPLGIMLGIITAKKRGKWQDTVLTLFANLSASIPSFVIAVAFLYLFCIKLRVLPATGFTFPWVDFGKHISQIILPMFCLSLGGVAGICRQTRSSMLEAMHQDYVRTARAKGLKENFIINKHVVRNGLIPIITLIGGRLAGMIGGSIFIENVFAIPGMGALMVQAVHDVDIPVMQACVMLTALVISVSYLITDFLYVAVDPRITLK